MYHRSSFIRILITVVLAVVIVAPYQLLSSEQRAQASTNYSRVGYFNWGTLSRFWNDGDTLASEPSLAYLTHIIGPEIVIDSASNPSLSGLGGDLSIFTKIVNAAHSKGLKSSPYLYARTDTLNSVVQAGTLPTLVTNIKNLIQQYNLDGIELDFEGLYSSQSNLNSLVDALYVVLNPLGKEISMSAQYGQFKGLMPDVSLATAQKMARIDVMCYDFWGYPDQSNGYPHSTLDDSISAMNKWLDAGYPKNKLCMGIPFFGKNPGGTSTMYYIDIVEAINPPPQMNSATIGGISYWWSGMNVTKLKADWVRDNNLAGVMIFGFGYDKLNDSRSLLKAINDELSTVDPPPTPPSVLTSAAGNITSNGATLNGNLTAAGSVSIVSVSFEYGLTTSYGSTAAGVPLNMISTGSFTANITGLTRNTLYHYRAKAVGDGTGYGSDQTFTTQAAAVNPSVTTGSAGNITPGGATLNGTLVNKGSASSVSVYINYGTTTNYGSTKSCVPETLTTPGTFSAALTGLTPNTLYHYRAKAVGDGTGYGSDQTFTTQGAAASPSVTTGSAGNITTSGASLNGTLVNKGSASSVTVYIDYGTTTNYGSTRSCVPETLTAPGTFSAALTGLTPNTLYHYRAKAVGDGTGYGNDQTFTTQAAAVSPSVTTGSAGNITPGGAVLNGTLVNTGSASSVTVYISYGTTTNYGSTRSCVPETLTAPGTFSVALTGLTPNTLYHYRAKAVGDGTGYGSDQTFTTQAAAVIPNVTTGSAGNITTSGASLNGTLVNKGSASSVTVYIDYGTTTNYGSTISGVPETLTAPGTFSAALTGLTPNTLYHYRAKAVGDGTGYGSDQTFTTQAAAVSPSVTTDSAGYITTSGATLNGTLVNTGSASSVKVYISYGTTTNYGFTRSSVPETMTAPGTFSIALTGLTPNTLYHYRVRAIGDGTGYGSDQTFTTQAAAASPSVTTDSAGNITTSGADLNGTLINTGSASSVTVYISYGTTTDYGSTISGVPETMTAPGTFLIALTGLTPNTLYHYRVKAVGDGTGYGSDQTFTTMPG